MGDSLVTLVREALKSGKLEEFVNKTLIILILKIERPELVMQFKPIRLYTVPYEMLTKVLMNWLKL